MNLKQSLNNFMSNTYLNFGDKLPSKSTTFILIKYVLIVFICLILAASVILIPFAPKLIHELEPHATPEQLSAYKAELILGLVVIVIFFAIGFYGVYKEHFCMSAAFTIFMIFLLIGSIADEANGIIVIAIFTICSIAFSVLIRSNKIPVTSPSLSSPA